MDDEEDEAGQGGGGGYVNMARAEEVFGHGGGEEEGAEDVEGKE